MEWKMFKKLKEIKSQFAFTNEAKTMLMVLSIMIMSAIIVFIGYSLRGLIFLFLPVVLTASAIAVFVYMINDDDEDINYD